MASVVNLRDRPDLRVALDGAEEQGETVRIDRRTRWGNPFLIGRHGTVDIDARPWHGQTMRVAVPFSVTKRRSCGASVRPKGPPSRPTPPSSD